MRPILLNIPAKPLFFAALILAVVFLVRDLLRRRNDKTAPWSSTPIYLLVGAGILNYFKTDHVIPSAAGLAQTWTPVPIYAYGVMLGTSLVVGWFIAMTLAKHDGIDQQEAGSLYMWGAIWSIIGSRLLWYFTTPGVSIADIPMINQGGLVAYGGMIGGTLATWYCCRKRGIPLLQWADVAAPSVVLGTGITRVGCLLFGCDFGARSSLPWAITFPKGSPAWNHHVRDFGLAQDALRSLPVHPTQVYESLVGLFLFALLMLIRKYRTFSGQVFLGWVLGYGILRPLIEIVRDDDQRGNVGPLSTSQFIGIASVVLGLALFVSLLRKYRRDPEGSRLWLRPVPATAGGGHAKAEHGGGKRRKRR